jgi:Tfp pilus assembly protein PilN
MIEINLLPGAVRKTRGGAAGAASLAASFKDLSARVKDPYLASAVAAVAVAVLIIGFLFVTQARRDSVLSERLAVATQDSIRYAAVIAEKRRAEGQRDSVVRQVNIIKSIDDDRFVWSRLLDEISKALPTYTWLTSVTQTSAVVSAAALPEDETAGARAAPRTATAAAAAAAAAAAGAGADAETPTGPPPLTFSIVGNTVDLQALTRFMRQLEASPFIRNVVMTRSTGVLEGDETITEFELLAQYEVADSSAIRRTPLTLSVR